MQSILPPCAALCGHLLRSPKGVQNLIHTGGVRFDQNDVRFEFGGVRRGWPTNRAISDEKRVFIINLHEGVRSRSLSEVCLHRCDEC
jgi:hypothetical protein